MTKLQQWLDNLPTTNAKLALGMAFAILTALGFVGFEAWLTWWAMRHPGAALGLPDLASELPKWWLTFLAAFLGLGVIQFGWKRQTEDPDVVAAHAAAALSAQPVAQPAATPAATPAPAPVRATLPAHPLAAAVVQHAFDPGA